MRFHWLYASLLFMIVLGNDQAIGQRAVSPSSEIKEILMKMDSGDPLLAVTTHELALSYKSQGYFSLAKETFLEGMNEFKNKDSIDNMEFAFMMADLGELYWEKGEWTISQDLYSDAENILSRKPEAIDSEQYLKLKVNLAIANARLGNNLSAMMGFNQIRTLFEREYENQQTRIVSIILRIADVYSEIENLQQAESFYDEAEDLLEKMEVKDEKLSIDLLLKKAAYQKKLSDFEKAIDYQNEALKLIKSFYGMSSIEFAEANAYLGSLYLENKQVYKAQVTLTVALDIEKELFGTYHRNYIETLELLGDLYRTGSNRAQAAEYYDRAISELIRQLKLLSPIMGVQEKTGYFLTVSDIMDKYASLAEMVTDQSSQIYSRLIDQSFIIDDLRMHSPTDLSSGGEELTKWRDSCERLLYLLKQPQSRIEGGSSTLEKQEKEILIIEKKLLKKNSVEIKRGHINKNSWKEIQPFLKEGEAAVQVFSYPWFSSEDISIASNEIHYLFMYFDDTREKPGGILLKNGNDLENRFLTHYRNSINHKFPNDYAYEVYWEPLKKHLGNYSTVRISPTGAYSQINLLTLQNIETGNYLIDEQNIHLVTSITHFNQEVKSSESVNDVHIFGNPDYNWKNEITEENILPYEIYISDQGESGMYYMRDKIKQQILWNELLYVDGVKFHEVELLDDMYKYEGYITNIYNQSTEIEAQLKSLKSPHTLHISTHGYFMEDDDINPGKYLDNQLLHSGLIFSGSYDYLDNEKSSSSLQDGLLTAFEIADLELDETELIFLSHCETGLGIVHNGNAITNFQHAFQEAGVESLIMTMWTTEAEYELEFMNLFYYHWLYENMTKKEAFIQSVQIMKNSYEKPYYWGSFIFVGE
jgi:CHAT domain-containing protein/tetratricopeptide (TPR) repeat protein